MEVELLLSKCSCLVPTLHDNTVLLSVEELVIGGDAVGKASYVGMKPHHQLHIVSLGSLA